MLTAMNSNRGGDGAFGRAKAAAVQKYLEEYGPESPECLGSLRGYYYPLFLFHHES